MIKGAQEKQRTKKSELFFVIKKKICAKRKIEIIKTKEIWEIYSD